jgi:hypothetical protein
MKFIYLFLFAFVFLNLSAQDNAFLSDYDREIPDEANKEFRFLALFYTQGVGTNIYPTNDFLKGQIIGRLYGQNTTTTSDSLTAFYGEQRLLPFFIYSPKLFNGKATLRASLEIDWTWGDVAYGTGGNSGSGISADQVNIQTQNIEVEIVPAPRWKINVGLQRLFDTPHDTYRTFFNRMTRTGFRLNFWGTDGMGITVRKDNDYSKIKASFYQLYENSIQEADDVSLWEFMYHKTLNLKTNVGFGAYYLRDRASGEGGPSILGQGLNSTLTQYNGTYRFTGIGSSRYQADVFWLGAFFDYNESMLMDTWFASAYANVNMGSVRTEDESGEFQPFSSILGLSANARVGYRYGQTERDRVSVDFLYTTGDENGNIDERYSGVMTGNTWGSPAGLNIGHGGYLLFPHANVVNRYVSAVPDLSNMGYGIIGGTVNASYDFVPHKWNAKVGGAWALSGVAPPGGGRQIGSEINARIQYDVGPFMSVEAHAAYMWLGSFYESNRVNTTGEAELANPWTSMIIFRWLMF